MSDWALGKKLNSQIADVPLNHLIWLQDYKTYGEDSYVFQNKDIYNELMQSVAAINDISTFGEVLDFISEDGVNFGSFFKNFYPVKANRERIAQLTSTSGLFTDSAMAVINDIANCAFCDMFFGKEYVMKNLSSIDVCKALFCGASIPALSAIESSVFLKKYADLNESIESASASCAYGKPSLVVENAFITTVEIGVATSVNRGAQPKTYLKWMDDSTSVVQSLRIDTGSNSIASLTSPTTVNVYRFVKQLVMETLPDKVESDSTYWLTDKTTSKFNNKINYIPLVD